MTPYAPNKGLRGIARAEYAARVARNRADGPAAMARIHAAAQRHAVTDAAALEWERYADASVKHDRTRGSVPTV
jgi:hypothetical protein